MQDPIEDRLQALESEVLKLHRSVDGPKPKDSWDKLAAFSTVLSGVIIASIGIWVNHSLTTAQIRAQQAQAQALETQGSHALELQAKQAADSLKFQTQQADDQKDLENLRIKQQKQQAADSLAQQREHDRAAFLLQQTQLAKDFMPQLEASPRSRATALKLMATVSPTEALILSENFSETSGSVLLRQTSESVIRNIQKSPDPVLRKAASDTQDRISVSKRIQAVVNVFESGQTSRDYSRVATSPGTIFYGGFIESGEPLYQVLNRYCDAANSQQSAALRPYLDRVRNRPADLVGDAEFRKLLVNAASDPVMQQIQDDTFEQEYWNPVQAQATRLGVKYPLSIAALLDTITSMDMTMSVKFESSANSKLGNAPANGADEKSWISAYVEARYAYIGSNRSVMERGKTMRVDFYRDEIKKNNWNLDPPFKVMGTEITD